MAVWTVRAVWDDEADVWFVIESDIPALYADAATVDGLAAKAVAMLPDLLDIHAEDFAPEVLVGPHSVHVVAFHEVRLPAAA